MPRVRECHDGLFEGAVTERVIGAFYTVYNRLGFGFLESVYERALAVEITERGLHVATQVPTEVQYHGQVVGTFKADVLVESRIVVELKSSKLLPPESEMQLRNYLRATNLEVGLLLHFGPKPSFKRLIATNQASRPRRHPRHPSHLPDGSFTALVADARPITRPASP